jgi:hypothetical protein
MPEEFKPFDQTAPTDLAARAADFAGCANQQRRNDRWNGQRGVDEVGSRDAEKIDKKTGDDWRRQLCALHQHYRHRHRIQKMGCRDQARHDRLARRAAEHL